MTRRMSTKRRAEVFERCGGICHICGDKIDGTRERWDVEHIVPYALTRDDSDENLAPAHVRCHAAKTKDDVRNISKAKRVHRKAIGAHKAKTPLPGGKDSKWKRTFNNGWIKREKP